MGVQHWAKISLLIFLHFTGHSICSSCCDIASMAVGREFRLGMTKRRNATEETFVFPVDERAQLVRDIALRSHKDAINLSACRALIQTIPRSFFKEAQVALAALQVDRSLVERVLIISESALGVVKFPNDRHAHLAMSLLEDAAVFEEVANIGNAQGLQNAQNLWRAALSDWRRDLLKHYRDRFVAHRAEPPAQTSQSRNWIISSPSQGVSCSCWLNSQPARDIQSTRKNWTRMATT